MAETRSESTELPLAQASAIPYRRTPAGVEFCLITSMQTGKWGFPKGIIDPGDTAPETALKESHEEAGLVGQLVGEPLGEYEYAKWGRTLVVTVYLMRVDRAEETWLESTERRRRWATASETHSLLSRGALRNLLDRAIERLAE